MPSKPMTLLIVVVAIAGAWGLAQVDRKRDVPWLPPQLEALVAAQAGVAPALIDEPAPLLPPGRGHPGGVAPKPVPPTPAPPKPVPPDAAGAPDLVPIEVQATVAPKKGDTDAVAILKIGPDGSNLRWSGFDAGSFAMLADLIEQASENPDFQLVIAPDKQTPWKYVWWAMELAREAGITDVGLGVTALSGKTAVPDMQMYAAPQPTAPYEENPEFPEIRVTVTIGEDGKPAWTIDAKKAASRQELFEAVGSINSEYAEMMEDGDYTRSPTKNPWVVIAGPDVPAKDVIQTLGAIRMAAIYTVRFGGEFPPNPGKK